ncbi:hypothetical protein B0A52_01652 [Exophiala mesophila]|uniref:Uncharacterized protein n=1 Tax=Exophiala mesophila TaxID=212818 RepID=A0A438NFN2_EXOME|nr:hypothetical protein B0A52_01652 [Exophiala mesophila]
MAAKVLQTNFDVDYVVSYRMCDDKTKGIAQFQKLIRVLNQVGLTTEVRRGDETSLLIFLKAADEKILADVVYRSRIKDWLHGIRQIQPVSDTARALTAEPLTQAERYRQIHHMITCSPEDGGAGITPQYGEWEQVEAIFPLHDHVKNKRWLTEFSRKTFLTPDDLDEIRDTVGEKIAYYYAFIQSYFTFMTFPAAFGFSCWVLLGKFSPVYAIVNGLWTVVFVEYWKRQEQELAINWGVKNVSAIEGKRKEFVPEKTATDPITGEKIAFFPAKKRLQRQLLQIPLALLCVVALGVVICTCYAIEIFISEIYDGPLKSILVFLPTIILTLAVPTISSYLTQFAELLTSFENYETQEAHDKAMVSKVFVINFITSYTAIFLTSFVYVPFATLLVPYLDIFSLTAKPFVNDEKQVEMPSPATFTINPNRLRDQMIYFAVTAQIVNFGMETIVPLLTQKGTKKYKEMQSSRAEKSAGAAPSISASDPPEEKEFLTRVREEAALPEYDVTTDLREMCIQFGYLSLFSVIWPLTPVCYFINNWIEIRGDTFKLTVESRRPTPERADSIGPWLDSLEFLAWLGSITSAALVYMFNGGNGPDGKPHAIKLWALLLSVFLSEHIFLVVRVLVRTAISKLDSAAQRKERSERFMVRKKYLEDAGLADAIKPLASAPNSPLVDSDGAQAFSNITRESLEEDARQDSLQDSDPSDRFWKRQRSGRESEQVGLGLIDLMDLGSRDKKQQ